MERAFSRTLFSLRANKNVGRRAAARPQNRPVAFAHFAHFDYSFGLNKF